MSSIRLETPFDPVLAAEISAMNRTFLNLLTHPRVAGQASLLGLHAGVLGSLRRLSPAQLDTLAHAPLLLAGFTLIPGAMRESGAAACQVADSGVPPEWADEALQFANRLLTSLWHYSRLTDGITGFCVGLDRAAAGWLAALSFTELCDRAAAVCGSLQARHAAHPTCWPDLVNTACTDRPEKLAAAQLSLIPLTVAASFSPKI